MRVSLVRFQLPAPQGYEMSTTKNLTTLEYFELVVRRVMKRYNRVDMGYMALEALAEEIQAAHKNIGAAFYDRRELRNLRRKKKD